MRIHLLRCLLSIFAMILCGYSDIGPGENEVFIIEKKGVIHKFLKADKENEYFVVDDFPVWENETFDVFDQFKDDQGIAIDIGAWIGATTIWLSKNFHHVLAIEANTGAIQS